MGTRKLLAAGWALAALLGLAGASEAVAQTGSVTGTVTAEATGAPMAGAFVSIEGTNFTAATQANGRFLILNVPAGTYQVTVQMIGYARRTAQVNVTAGASATVDFALSVDALRLEEIVVTGVVGETQRTKLPFTVDRVGLENVPVPSVAPTSLIQGRIAGAQVVSGSGRPGSAPSILLRGPTSINATGRDQDPLYIVDGVILGASIVDIETLDVESIEVVKGAAAASLYGSRAANGVIQITTRRGTGVGDGMRFSIRSEYGRSELSSRIPLSKAHHYRLNADKTKFVRTNGEEVDWLDGGNFALSGTDIWTTYKDQPWPGGTYDHIDRFFEPSNFIQNQVTMEGRTGNTNVFLSFSQLDQGGVILDKGRFDRQSFRLNIDQRLLEDLQISASTFFSRSDQDGFSDGSGNPLFNLTRMPAGVDLAQKVDGEYIIKPDPNEENSNPLEELTKRDRTDERQRFLGGLNLRYTPAPWFDLDANVSYDRAGVTRTDNYPKGFQTARASVSLNNGYTYRDSWVDEALNASATATFRRTFGELATRTQFRYLYETSEYNYHRGSSYNLVVEGIPQLDAGRDGRITRSSHETIRSEGLFAITNFDYRDRYIADLLVRRDGSSLFGPEERWHTYYRGAFAWRVSEEDWWFLPSINEAKLRYSIGTAGGRPNFSAQYETYDVTDGNLSPSNLGNRALKPEYAIEQEMGIDIAAFNRINLGLTYATSTVEDQILRVPLPAVSGFLSQWQNAGTLESNTWEASLEAILYQSPDLNWSARLLFDRTRQTITELNVPEYQYGIPSVQGLEGVFYAREGEALGTMYGTRFATSCADLPSGVPCSEFDVNDDGYLVWVGEGGSWRDVAWGQNTNFNGVNYFWGAPFTAVDENGDSFTAIGSGMPDYSYSISSTLQWRGFSLYGLLDAVRGVNVYNLPRHWATFQNYNAEADQIGKSEETRKPIGYYSSLYFRLSPPNSHFMEDGSYLKLRELSLRYTFDRDALSRVSLLSGVDRLSLNLIGRNLHTWTNYTGFDPEVGFAGGDVGSAAISRFDGFNYPKFRTITAAIEIAF